jgi:FkbM family methyltransferase
MSLSLTAAPFKVFVARTLCHPIVGGIVATLSRDRIRVRGLGVDTSDPAIAPSVKASLFWGFYESAESRFVRRYLLTDCDAIELGSSLGIVSCHMRRRLITDRRLVCVEANLQLLPVLEMTLRLNRCDENVTIIGGAIDYAAGDHASVWFSPGASNVQGRVAPAAEEGTQTVPALTLTGVIDRAGIDGDFTLVCDIEGAEAQMIAHEREMLARCRQIVVELHQTVVNGQVIEPADLVASLVRCHGFKLVDQYGPVFVFDR